MSGDNIETAFAYWAVAPGRGEIHAVSLRPPRPHEVLVRAQFSGISRGTETLVALGRVPASQWTAMRAPFQAGEFPFPVKYGYASVGTVIKGPPNLVGHDVFCLFPHQTAYVVPAAAVVLLPPNVPPCRAVLAANMETALNIVWDAAVLPGECVHVIGAGVIGCLVAWLIGRLPGTEVTLADIDSARATVALQLGVPFALPEELVPDADLIIHASGTPAGLFRALQVAGVEARIVEASWYGDQQVTLSLGEAFHSRRLKLISSQVGAVASTMRPRWTHMRRLEKALELLCEPVLDALITGAAPFERLPELMPVLAASSIGTLCQQITYGLAPEKWRVSDEARRPCWDSRSDSRRRSRTKRSGWHGPVDGPGAR